MSHRTPILPHRRKSEKKARAATKGERPKASKPGQCTLGAIGKFICICMMLMFIASASCEIYKKFRTRQVEFYSTTKNANERRQGRSNGRASAKVSNFAYSNCKNLRKAGIHIKMNVLQCEEIAQKEGQGLATTVARAKSQKPSPVSGKFEFNFAPKSNMDSNVGLITPKSEPMSKKIQRQNKIRRLARQFRSQRQKMWGLLTKKRSTSQQQ